MFVYCLYLAGNLLWIPLPGANAFSYFVLPVTGLSNHMKWNGKCSFIFLYVAFYLTFLLPLNVKAPVHCQASASSSMTWPMSGESHSTLKPVTAMLLDTWKRLTTTIICLASQIPFLRTAVRFLLKIALPLSPSKSSPCSISPSRTSDDLNTISTQTIWLWCLLYILD